MTGRERLLTAIHRGKLDRLPGLIHARVDDHLKDMLHGMDPVIYTNPNTINNEKDFVY
jgi:hypothetical protein